MLRRDFCRTSFAAALGLPLASAALGRSLLNAAPEWSDVRATGIKAFRVRFERPKMVGKNSRLDVHGDHGYEQFWQVETDAGVTGFGWCPAGREAAEQIVGQRLSRFFREQANGFRAPFERGTAPLWDILGKLRGEPVWKLLGGKGPETVGVYDGSIYFADLLPEHKEDWRDQFRREIDMGMERGHLAFKVKVGRGAKWMERAAGDARDLEVLALIREHGGKKLILGIDANNAFTLESAKGFMAEAGKLDIAFAEEMFEETVLDCRSIKNFYQDQGWETLVADGETKGSLDDYRPLAEARAIDVIQGDMRHFDFEGVMEMAEIARSGNAQIAPHNWGSVAGFFMMLQVGRAVENFYRAEQDPGSSPVLVSEGVKIEDGRASVPETPGAGLAFRPEAKPEHVEELFGVRA